MTDKNKFKDTLNLPTTSFSLRANAAEKEPALQKWWQEEGIEKEYFAKEGKGSFVLHDGPPYANGHIHLGTTLNKTLKDMVVRCNRLIGKKVSYRPGWDCHGLPIELKVAAEQKVAAEVSHPRAGGDPVILDPGSKAGETAPAPEGGNRSHDPIAFKRACRTYAQKWRAIQEKEFKNLGVFGEWDNAYMTMHPHYQATILRCLGEFVGKGYIERKGKTIPWCFSCETVLANIEIEYADRKDPSCYILFPLTSALRGNVFNDIDSALQLNVLIWTTTPWTIPLNRAVVLHPDAQYALVQVSETQACLVGADLVEKLSEVLGENARVIKTLHSSELVGNKVQHPLVDDLQVPLIADHGVSTTDGTACLHSAPGCGPEDYLMGIKNGLEIFSPLSSDGRYTQGIQPVELQGEKITDGQWWVLKKLKERGALLHKANIKHSYPHCWRCQNGLMFRATDQWFCNLEKNNLITNAQKQLDTVDFMPAWGKTRLHSFLDNRTEWCISRQRQWGIAIPALFNAQTGEAHISQEFVNAVADRVAQEGIEFWDRVTIADLREAGLLPAALASLSDDQIRKESDILDVWFDSGVSHRAVISAAGGTLPVDLYLEGSDQHRGWFQSSYLSSMVLNGAPQTKAILTHGFVVDKHGHKMAKSRGNAIDPQSVIDKYGIDVVRLWVASVDYERDVVISDDLLKNTAEVYRKLRNTARFLLMNLYDFDPSVHAVPYDQLGALDAHALRETLRVNDEVIELYKNYKFANAIQVLTKYCTTALSSFYLDMVKDRLYVEATDSATRRSAQTVLHTMVTVLTRLLAPVLVHAAEDMHHSLPYKVAEKSIHLTEFYKETQTVPAGDAVQWKALEELRVQVLRAIEQQREAGMIKHSLEAKVALPASAVVGMDEAFLKEWFIVSQVTVGEGFPGEELGSSQTGSSSKAEEPAITVTHADGVKCPRCWHWSLSEHADGLCARCVKVIG